MPEILVTLGDQIVNKYVFDKDVISIGRSRDNDVCVENLAVSRNHARIRRQNDSFLISDLNSANGTFVNGVRIQKTELFNDDVITIGKHKIIFKNEAITDEALISDAFGAERTMIMDKVPTAYVIVTRGKQKDTEFKINKAETTIGRSADCEIRLYDWFVSKQHAVIHRQGNTFLLRDPGSWKGTRVNDIQVTEAVLQDGDEIQVGGTRLLFRLVSADATPAPSGRIPLELERPTERADYQPAPAPDEPLAGLEPEPEEAPVAAEGLEEFAEEPTPEMAYDTERTVSQPLDELEPELREGADMIAQGIGEIESLLGQPPEPVAEELVAAEPATDEEIAAEEPPVAAEVQAEPPAAGAEAEAVAEGVSEERIRMWEKALGNKSPVIRKQAARMLKKLTGKDYDY